ncbi:hypothetical protein [Brevundimonas sp. Root1279]|uniref:hypothetical protein n=1 Tax=Brevundimonas sp. Root1279 TaxID=1736443 RepID=UPI000701D9F8|nr:hypothetical protein [Brevundimonas sp. Root1279]KQW78863.1 hypothetical protein ASC65_16280 [Brevundimonas sp. Root1279]
METLTPAHAAAFEAVVAKVPMDARNRIAVLMDEAAAAAAASAPHWDFDQPGHRAEEALAAAFGSALTDDHRRALVASWALELPARIVAADLPQASLELYPEWIGRLADFLSAAADPYDRDFWAKDVRIALALSVPGARTQMIDLSSPMGPGQVLRHAREGWGWSVIPAYAAAQAWKPWLEVHTESRELGDFNEAGWDRAWATAAEILKRRPDMAGMLGSSWFYDPPLEQISPRLAYLRVNPLKHGAFLVHQGPGEIHTERAATSSPTRKSLIEKGEYTARSWIVAWPRAALIRWADARKAGSAAEAA